MLCVQVCWDVTLLGEQFQVRQRIFVTSSPWSSNPTELLAQ
jgi:hypothetical protein